MQAISMIFTIAHPRAICGKMQHHCFSTILHAWKRKEDEMGLGRTYKYVGVQRVLLFQQNGP